MKAIITADWHFGLPDKLVDQEWAFNGLLSYCENNGVTAIFIIGDLMDDRRYVTHDVSNKVVELFKKAKDRGILIASFPGNHDMFWRFSWRDTAIGPYADHITYFDDIGYFIFGERKFWVIPFIEHEDIYQRVLMEVSSRASADDVLLTHIGVSAAVMNISFQLQNWSVVSFENTVFSKVFTGHFHCHQKVGLKTWYPGSPLAWRYDEGVVEHGFIVYDTASGDHEFINIYDAGSKTYQPPEFVTIVDQKDLTSELVTGNNVKIMLNVGDNEDEIRAKLTELGAKNISFTKVKEKEIDFSSVKSINSDGMFESWLDFDKPKDFDTDTLLALNKEVELETPSETEDDD